MRWRAFLNSTRKWRREPNVGNNAVKLMPDPVSFIEWPLFSMRRSTSRFGMGCFVLGANLYSTGNSPSGVLSSAGSGTGNGDFEVLKFVRDLRAAAGEFVIKADRKIGPGLGIGCWISHVIVMVPREARMYSIHRIQFSQAWEVR